MVFYINSQKENSSKEIAYILKKCILHHPGRWSELIFLCIGTDRVTGDCLGPYIGQQLSHLNMKGIYVYGTLEQPVHALNLPKISRYIKSAHPDGLIIAIDASLGQKKHLGYVTIGSGALYPGAGVQKELPPVGDIHITGIVNIGGVLEQLTLQTTRLSTVISMADAITQGILCYTNALTCL
ncbi:MAG: spore protease YyaC [Blautia sp.]|nr:spore protease YyaC [Blautia sp.]